MGSDTKSRRWGGFVLAGLASAGLVVACNTHPAEFVRSTGAIEILETYEREASPKLDILWMIDNSGSMCQEQKALRDNFGEFVDILAEIDLDFHIGITTTHMVGPDHSQGAFEPVALPGHLQLTPQPIPGFDTSCFYQVDQTGQPVYDAPMEPILDAIQTAVGCTNDPTAYAHLLNPDMNQLRCAFDQGRWRTTLDCTNAPAPHTFFPNPADYRDIGQGRKYIRAEDYRNEDRSLRIDELRQDFACASMVGTRGYGMEKGLAAIVRAFDPELTGGPEGDPAVFPNAGFLRPDARTGVIIVTDENDCSHDGTLNEVHSCGSSMCEMAENWVPSPLIPVEKLKDDMLANLLASKGLSITPEVLKEDVLVASIHGPHQPYPHPGPTEDGQSSEDVNECRSGWSIPTSCASLKGVAYSGHRYDAFMRQFNRFFPSPPSSRPDAPVAGLICEDFGSALQDIANLFRTESGGCITEIFHCEGPEDNCPAFAYSGDSGTCTAYPQGNQGYYCDSGIQVRIHTDGADAAARLEATGYCEPGSIDTPDFPNGCVVHRSHYTWAACPGDGRGVQLEWNDPQSHNVLSGMGTQIRYAKLPPRED